MNEESVLQAKRLFVDRARERNLRPAMTIVGLVALGSVAALSVDTRFVYLLVYAWFGVIYGLLLQYGRFCMASAVRDLFAVGVPRMAVGMLIAVALFSLTAATVQAAGFSTFAPHPLGWHVILGGLIFGFGMVFTGGCASGSLYKAGEGNVGSMLVVFAISFSQAIIVTAGGWVDALAPASWQVSAAAKDMPPELTATEGWFDLFTAGYIWDLKGTTVAETMGMEGTLAGAFIANALFSAILPALALLVLIYVFYFRRNYLRREKITTPSLGNHLDGLWAMITSSKSTALAGAGLGLFAGMQMWITGALREHYGIFNFGELLEAMGYQNGLSLQGTVFDPGYWYITTQEAQWGGWILNQLGVENLDNIFFGLDNGLPNPLLNAPGFMSIGIILGAAVMAHLRREFKWKLPSLETAVFALIGGTLMGIGARIGMGCNIGAFFATVTNGDLSGWVFLAGMVGGGWLGVKAFNTWLEWRSSRAGECDF
ncbi:MAG: YeeE/YedE family protein [Thiohalomonadaceae bacterium]